MDRATIRQMRGAPAQFRAEDAGNTKTIEGYFAVFGENYELWPGATESVAPEAFDGALSGDVRALIDHQTNLVLGRTKAGTLELRTDSHGLWGKVTINEIVLLSNIHNLVHLCRKTCHVNYNDTLGLWSDCFLNLVNIYFEMLPCWFNKNRHKVVLGDGKDGCNISVGRNDNLVTILHDAHLFVCTHYEVQCI